MNPKELEAKEAAMRKKIKMCAEENSLSGEDIAPIYDGIYSAEKYLNSMFPQLNSIQGQH